MGLVNPFELLGGTYDWFISLSFAFLGVFTTRMLFYGLINTRTFLMQKLAIDIFINFLQNPPNHFLLEKLKK